MSLIASDPSIYALGSDVMKVGKFKGVAIGQILDDDPEYIMYLIDKQIITVAGQLEERVNHIADLIVREKYGDRFADDNSWNDGLGDWSFNG